MARHGQSTAVNGSILIVTLTAHLSEAVSRSQNVLLTHEHLGTHDGQEAGFVCSKCHDGIMGIHKSLIKGGTHIYR